MAVQTETGVFMSATGTGNQTITFTDSGLTAQAIILWTDHNTVVANGMHHTMAMGFGCTDGTQGACSVASRDAQGTSETWRRSESGNCLAVTNIVGSELMEASIGDMTTAGQVVINWGVVTTARRIYYMAIGGLEDCTVHVMQEPGSTGNDSQTGVGFQPDRFITMSIGRTSTNATASANLFSIGFGNSASCGAIGFSDEDGQATTDSDSKGASDAIANTVWNGSDRSKAVPVSEDADGFTWNWNPINTTNFFYVLCLKGCSISVDTITEPATDTTASITGLSFAPKGAFGIHAGQTGFGSVTNDLAFGWGVIDTADANSAIAGFSTHGQGTSICDRDNEDDECISHLLSNAGQGGEASGALDAAGITLTFANTDGTQRVSRWMTIGDPAASDSTGLVNRGLVSGGLVDGGLAG